MSRPFSIFAILCLVAALVQTGAAQAAGERRLVLVVNVRSEVAQYSAMEARKLFLGVPQSINDQALQPLRNTSDAALEEMFLQRVLFMSRDAYDRRLLTNALHTGAVRPVSYDSEANLVGDLLKNDHALTYMWRDAAVANPGIKIVAEP